MYFVIQILELFTYIKEVYVISFCISGVGADDTFILVKAWNAHSKADPNLNSVEEQLEAIVKAALRLMDSSTLKIHS